MKKIYLVPILLALFACSNENTMVQEIDLGQDVPDDQEISSSSEEAVESSSSREASTIESSSSETVPESASDQPESSSESPESSATEVPESSSSERIVINFDSLPSFVDARDSQSYKYITIGEQVWMAENLRYRKGFDSLNHINDWCYNNHDDRCADYGALYTWSGAMNVDEKYNTERLWRKRPDVPVQGICPEGWHLPTTKDFEVLQKLSGNTNAYEKLRAPYSWENGTVGTNEVGFFAVGSGYLEHRTPTFTDSLNITGFWAASDITYETADVFAIITRVMYRSPTKDKRNGYSVRCIKGEGEVLDSSNIYDKPIWNDMNQRVEYDLLIDKRDNHFYRTVTIGDQTWMAENLNYYGSWGGYCIDNKEENCELYGRQYYFTEALEIAASSIVTYYRFDTPIQGVCPNGWHVPDTTEWNTLFNYVKNNTDKKFPLSLITRGASTGVDINNITVNFWGYDNVGFSIYPFYLPRNRSNPPTLGTRERFISNVQYSGNHTGYHAYDFIGTDIAKNEGVIFSEGGHSVDDSDAHVRCIKN